MPDDAILRAKEVHAGLLRKTSKRMFYFFSIAICLGFFSAALRPIPFDPLLKYALPVFLIFSVAPHFILPGDQHYTKRVLLFLLGLFLAAITGITFLGLSSAGWLVLLTIPMITGALLGKRGAYLTLTIVLLVPLVLGSLYSTGVIQARLDILGTLSENGRNWLVMGTTLLFCGIACITLTENLRQQWENSNRAAHKQHEQMLALVEYAPEAIMIFDMGLGKFITTNTRAEEILGYSREELMETISPRDISPALQPDWSHSNMTVSIYLKQALKGEFPIFEWQLTNKNGQMLDCEISLARLPPFDRKLIRASVVDISARKAELKEHEKVLLQLAVSQKLEAVGKLTGGVAHDFNNLLAVTLGNLELLREGCHDEPHQKLIDNSIASTLRGADLTRNMLAFARKASLEPSAIDINAVVPETKTWISRPLPATILVETSLPTGLWPVEADLSSTESALLNLILNAQDAMPEGGKLTIETRNIHIENCDLDPRQEELEPGRYVMLAVSDTGEGIPPENIAEIFEPFFSTKETGNNSGLGLSMVHGFMRQSNGTVQVCSEPGLGTTFKLYFRVAAEDPLPSPVTETTSDDAVNKGRRILVAEDDAAVLDVVVKTLQKVGYEVTAASSGDAAKAIFDADPHFDLLLTDIVMPGTLPGTSLSSALRAKDPDLQVIFMSGYASEATVHSNGLRPEDIRLMKPVQRTDLLAAIKKSLGH
jgi:PAS domain S-box-containing protein